MQLLCITILIGFLAELVARWVTPRNGANGFVLTITAGIVGALVTAFFGQLLHWYKPSQLAGFAGTVAGAAILLAGYRVLAREHRVGRLRVELRRSELLCE